MDPNILLIVLDSARARNMSLYGYERETTPNLNQLEETATVYDQARAPARWSLPSHVSLFTGHHVTQHGVCDEQHRFEGSTVWDSLSNRGYETGLFSYNVFLVDETFGLRQSFDHVVGQLDVPYEDGVDPKSTAGYLDFISKALKSEQISQSIANGLATKFRWLNGSTGRNHGGVYVDAFTDWINAHDEPWGACINFMDTHFPYVPNAEHNLWGSSAGERLRDNIDKVPIDLQAENDTAIEELLRMYDGTIRQADALVKRLLDVVDLSSTLVVITADHGEGFGEYSRIRDDTRIFGHAYGLHESQLHVPLIVKSPSQKSGNRKGRLASITEFPEVVKSHLSETDATCDFTVDRGYASTHKVHYGDELTAETSKNFDGESYALYEFDGNCIRKHLWWDDTEVTVNLNGDQPSIQDGDGDVRDVFDALDEVSTNAGVDSVSKSTAETLEELGYL